MKKIIMKICLVVVFGLMFVCGCQNKSSQKVTIDGKTYNLQDKKENEDYDEKLRSIVSERKQVSSEKKSELVCGKGKWIDKKTYTFDSEMKILSIATKPTLTRFLKKKVDKIKMNIEVAVGNVSFLSSLIITPGESELYGKYQKNMKYPVTITLVKGGYFDNGSWVIYNINNESPIHHYVAKQSVLDFIEEVEKLQYTRTFFVFNEC
ncbi:MAG: hypothetical protein KKF50_05330 [Nanoarchaeota archaeon]|nr:hypothetical protein [Nanoarchaeota archaeon]